MFINELPVTVSLFDLPVLVASWFGAGKVEPLTSGLALASVWPIAAALAVLGRLPLVLVTMLAFGTGIWAATAWEALLGIEDDGRVVIDEVAGYLAVLAIVGRAGWVPGAVFAAGFLLLDSLKPWPLRSLETLPGGVGVMLDDLGAGIAMGLAALAVCHLLKRWHQPRGGAA